MSAPYLWEIEGLDFANCNCSYGCPCQFAAPPTQGHCRAVVSTRIERGYHGDVRLDGLSVTGIYRWPGAIHEGNGEMQLIVDRRADERQRAALLRILTGQDTDDVATHWWVFSAMSPTRHKPVFTSVELEVDVDGRTARLQVPELVESEARPIRNPVSGADVRARIDLPNGFEFRLGEIGSASSRTRGPIAFELKDSWGLFARIHLSNKGVVEQRRAPGLA